MNGRGLTQIGQLKDAGSNDSIDFKNLNHKNFIKYVVNLELSNDQRFV